MSLNKAQKEAVSHKEGHRVWFLLVPVREKLLQLQKELNI